MCICLCGKNSSVESVNEKKRVHFISLIRRLKSVQYGNNANDLHWIALTFNNYFILQRVDMRGPMSPRVSIKIELIFSRLKTIEFGSHWFYQFVESLWHILLRHLTATRFSLFYTPNINEKTLTRGIKVWILMKE